MLKKIIQFIANLFRRKQTDAKQESLKNFFRPRRRMVYDCKYTKRFYKRVMREAKYRYRLAEIAGKATAGKQGRTRGMKKKQIWKLKGAHA